MWSYWKTHHCNKNYKTKQRLPQTGHKRNHRPATEGAPVDDRGNRSNSWFSWLQHSLQSDGARERDRETETWHPFRRRGCGTRGLLCLLTPVSLVITAPVMLGYGHETGADFDNQTQPPVEDLADPAVHDLKRCERELFQGGRWRPLGFDANSLKSDDLFAQWQDVLVAGDLKVRCRWKVFEMSWHTKVTRPKMCLKLRKYHESKEPSKEVD